MILMTQGICDMPKKLVDGKEYGNKRIIRFVAVLAKREYYKVECLGCGQTFTMERAGILKGLKCRHCHAIATKPTIKTMQELPRWSRDN